jgi:hypothetical protein
MRVAVADTCIFIDLIKYDLINAFFELPFEIHTSNCKLPRLLAI